MAYLEVPDGMNFNTEFPTWIIAFCPDTDSWFATNKRFFYYEFPKEFDTEQEAIEYFVEHLQELYELNEELVEYRPSFNQGGIVFEKEDGTKFYPVIKKED